MSKKKKKDNIITSEGDILVVCRNKRAEFEYEITQTLEAGIVLFGTEVKSIRKGGVSFNDSYIRPRNGEAFLIGCHVSPYSHASVDAHELIRDRKLLLHKKEIRKLEDSIKQRGISIIPITLYFKSGKLKLEIGIGKGKKLYDKREDIKKREANRDMARAMKY